MDTCSPRIRQCRDADLGAVTGIEEACYGKNNALSRITLTQYLELCGPAFVLAEDTTGVIGFAIGGITLGTNGTLTWLLDVAVNPRVQGQGIGPQLCSGVIGALREQGATRVRATVHPSNQRSRNMLTHLGFTTIADAPDYFGNGEHRLIMECPIKGEER